MDTVLFVLLVIVAIAVYLKRPTGRKRSRDTGLLDLAVYAVWGIILLWLIVTVSDWLNYMATYHPRLSLAAIVIGGVLAVAAGYLYWRRRSIRWPFWTGRRATSQTRTLGELLMLSPSDFEQLVASVLERIGYSSVHCVGGSGDLAADIVCKDEHGRLIVVQCKRYATGTLVGSPELQKFMGMAFIHHKAKLGVFVSSSGFSQAAIELARGHPIVLIDGEGLLRLMKWEKDNRPGLLAFLHQAHDSPNQILASVRVGR